MSSRIGWYIHYGSENYKKYGTSFRDSNNVKGDLTASYARAKQEMNKIKRVRTANLTDSEKASLRSSIAAFMKNPAEASSKVQEAQQVLEREISKKFNKDMQNATLDIEKMALQGISTHNKMGLVHAHRPENTSGQLYLNLEEITKKLNLLETQYFEEISKNKKNKKELFRLLDLYKQLVGESVLKLSKYDFKLNPKNFTNIQGSYESIGDFRDSLNNLIQQYASFPDIVGIEGLSFEYAIPLAAWASGDLAVESAAEAVNKAVKGGNIKTNVKQYSKRNFAKMVTKLGDSTYLDASYNQRGKVDVALSWKGKKLKISAKNIKFHSTHAWATTVAGTPLLYMIQDMDHTFVNHFLNAHAQKNKTKNIDKNVANSLTNDDNDTTTQLMKQYLFYKSITGDSYNRNRGDKVNLMIINDKTAKDGILLLDLNDILQQAEHKLGNIKMNVGGRPISNFRLKNEWADAGYATRISTLLMEAHNAKIEAAYNVMAFK